MHTRAFIRALAAEAYIVLFALGVVYHPLVFNGPVPVVMGIAAFLSLFVCSAAIMGYLFIADPLLLAIAGKHTEAIAFFMRTVLFFVLVSIVAAAGLYFFIPLG